MTAQHVRATSNHTAVIDAVKRHARAQPDAIAYWTPARTWSFAQLEQESNRIAQGLLALGIGKGERVACLTKHTVECVLLTLAANKVGAVCMPVNWRLAPAELEYVLNNGQARLLMVDAAFAAATQKVSVQGLKLALATDQAAGGLPGFADWRAGFEARDPGLPIDEGDTALQLYSSGTTGLPKGVELTHRNIAASMIEATPQAISYAGRPTSFSTCCRPITSPAPAWRCSPSRPAATA